jgi:phage anti-repressor protein
MTLIEFLKYYSKISNNFIDDFFGFVKLNDRFSFNIDLDKISDWLKSKKSDLKETLINTYIENVDYTIQKDKSDKKGRKNEIILLTPKCFKLLCMKSKSKKADQVREYYLELEEIIDKYKDYIIDGLNTKIKQLEYNQKPKINPQKGIIYILQATDDIGLYKIGRSIKFKRRLREYQADKGNDIRPLYTFEVDDVVNVESCIKRHMKEFQYRKYKEIYQVDIDMIKNILKECEASYCKIQLIKKNKPIPKKQQNGGFNYFIAVFR